jgi:hypothetical protein
MQTGLINFSFNSILIVNNSYNAIETLKHHPNLSNSVVLQLVQTLTVMLTIKIVKYTWKIKILRNSDHFNWKSSVVKD